MKTRTSTKKSKKKRSPSKKQAIRELDELVSKIVRLRDGRCVTCGAAENLSCGHFEHRANYAIRWDLRNCNAQCLSCNGKHEHMTFPYRSYMAAKYGEGIFEELHELTLAHQAHGPWKIGELLELKRLLQAKYMEEEMKWAGTCT